MPGELLTADQVRDLLDIDRSTVYRMASDGRLPAVKIGRQWRFPRAEVRTLLTAGVAGAPATVPAGRQTPRGPATTALSGPVLSPVTDVVAEALGIMMLVTDMQGRPVTAVSNPCPWFAAHGDDAEVADACAVEWRRMADDLDLEPRFVLSESGFLCARAFLRSGSELVGMVLAGGIAPEGAGDQQRDADDGFHHLGADGRRRVLELLPRVATSLSRLIALVPATGGPTPVRDDAGSNDAGSNDAGPAGRSGR